MRGGSSALTTSGKSLPLDKSKSGREVVKARQRRGRSKVSWSDFASGVGLGGVSWTGSNSGESLSVISSTRLSESSSGVGDTLPSRSGRTLYPLLLEEKAEKVDDFGRSSTWFAPVRCIQG